MHIENDENQYRDFLKLLKQALLEEEIAEQIRFMLSSSEMKKSNVEEELQQQIQDLQNENKWLQDQLHIELEKTKQQKEMNQQINKSLTEVSNQYLSVKEQADLWRSKYQKINERFQEQIKIYETFQNLSPSLKSSLSGIFRGNSLEKFLFCGVQKQNVELLWDAIKIRVIDENYEELEELRAIFLYFFHAYNSTFEKPLYELQTVGENDKFDNELHIRTSKSRVSGYIKNTVFNGYINTNSKKTEKKSIVTL